MTGAFYLNGFASSAQSKKAAYFGERLRAHGVTLHCPDFNEPDFRSLTMTRMVAQVTADIDRLPDARVALIGSSLGAAVAIHAARRLPARVDRLVLLAPAVTFAKEGDRFVDPERLARWKADGSLEVFHYGYGETRRLDYAFYEDSLRYDPFDVPVAQPTLVFQGMRDALVDHRDVERWAAARPNVTLSLLDDDHQLMASLPRMWTAMAEFFGLC
jgi:pimeloyl-ACP methyl ester carboxylesterase